MVSEGSKARGFAIGIIIFQICTIISSSTGSSFYNTIDNDTNNFVSFLFICLLSMLGYGFIISSNRNSSNIGLFSTLIVVAATVTQQPLIGSAIYKIFAGICCSRVVSQPTVYYSSGQNLLSLYSLRLSMICASSLLIGFTAFGNKLGLLQTYTTATIFNAGWALAQYGNQALYNHSGVGSYIFDDYGTNYIYVFGGAFALINCAFLNRKPPKMNPDHNTIDQTSGYFGLIGTGFVFACFPFTGIIFPFSDTNQQTFTFYRFYEGPMNLYFGMAASIIFTYASSAFFGKGSLGIRELLLGTISGGIMIGSIAGVVSNIGIVLLFGSIAGFFSGWWLNVVHPKINQNRNFDNLGAIGPILIVAVFGGLIFGPVSLFIMYNKQLNMAPLGSVMTDSIASKISVGYFAVSLLIGTLAGLLAGYSNMKNRQQDEEQDFEDGRFLEEIYGLYDHRLTLMMKQKEQEEKLGPVAFRKYFVDQKIKRKDGENTVMESQQNINRSQEGDGWSSDNNKNVNAQTTMKRQMILQRNQ